MLKAPLVKEVLLQLNLAVSALGTATLRGSSFVFGYLGGGDTPFSVSNPNSLVIFRLSSVAAFDCDVCAFCTPLVLACLALAHTIDRLGL